MKYTKSTSENKKAPRRAAFLGDYPDTNMSGIEHTVLYLLREVDMCSLGADDATRTRNHWYHKPGLYQLSYDHHIIRNS